MTLAPPTPAGLLSESEARALTDLIKQAVEHFWEMLWEAHEKRAWEALGYPSWKAYVETELSMSERHSYRVLDKATVIHALQEATDPRVSPEVTERAARRLKPHLEEVKAEIRKGIDQGESPDGAVSRVLKETLAKHNAVPSPSEATGIARETGTMVLSSDGNYRSGMSDEVREKIGIDLERNGKLFDALETLAHFDPPLEIVNGVPDYQRFRVEDNLKAAVEWLIDFEIEWEQ